MGLFSKKPSASEREAREYEELQSLAMHDELQALAVGDHEEAAFADVRAYAYGRQAAYLRKKKR